MFPGADDIGNMFQFKAEFPEAYVKSRSLEESRQLNPELLTLKQWLSENASKIPMPD